MSSTSASDGSYTLTVTFDVGTEHRHRSGVGAESRADRRAAVARRKCNWKALVTQKQSTDIVLFVTLTSPDKRFDSLFLSNYATINLSGSVGTACRASGRRELSAPARTACGCGSTPTSSRPAISRRKMSSTRCRSRTCKWRPASSASRRRRPSRRFQYTVTTLGPADHAGGIRQYHHQSGPAARRPKSRAIKDVARVELGAQTYNQYFQVNGKPAAGIAIFQLPGRQCARRGQAQCRQRWSN